jgi:hypothetical protein
MARRGFGSTALRAALGAVTGVAEGLQQRDVVAAEKQRMADALARQQEMDAMDRARFLMQSNFRIAPEAYTTEDPAARSVLPPLEMPSAAPSSGARAGGALSAALNRGMGVDTTQPSMSRPGFGAKPLAMDSGGSRMTEMFERAAPTRPAQEAIAASVDLPGGMKMRFNAPETAAQITARTMADYEAKKKADAAIAAQAKADERKALDENDRELADVYVSAFVNRNGNPISFAQALAAVKSKKSPLDLGFSEKPMTEEERQRLSIMQGELGVSRDRLAFDKTQELQTKAEKAAKLAAAKKAANDVLPTVIAASNAVSKWGDNEIKSLNPFLIATQSAATLEGGTWGAVKSKALSKLGITNLDKEYLQYASAVADAVARASEVGVLTNQDINRFRSQVSFDGGENETQIRFKLNNLKSWASWLANSKKNIDAADGDINTLSSNYGSVAKIPGETDKEYESRTGKSATGANANPYR